MGLRVLLVTGRLRDELTPYLRTLGPIDGLVAENGAVIEVPIGAPPVVIGRRTAERVRRRLSRHPDLRFRMGEVVASVPRAERRRLLRAIAGLPVRVVPNVDRLMVLPNGVDKGSGARRALRRLGVGRGGYAAIGDAENDVVLLEGAVLSGAVANAVGRVRRAADYVCRHRYEQGVLEFVRGPLADRLRRPPSGPAA